MAIVSAEEFLFNHRYYNPSQVQMEDEYMMVVMREFAEMHRQEALENAKNKARTQHVVTRGADYYIVNKDSILNAYSKKNIR